MKAMKSSNSETVLSDVEIRIAQHAARMDRIHANKPIIVVLIIAFICMIAKVYGQTGLEDKIATVNDPIGVRVAGFVKDFPQAEKLPGYINTSFKEVGPLVSPDGKTLYFSRQNYPDNTGGVLDCEDIWYSTYNGLTGEWGRPEKMETPINNYGPNSVNFVSVTGDTILLANEYGKNGKMRSGISMSIRQMGHWSFPEAVNCRERLNMSDQFDLSMSYNKQVILTSQELTDSYGSRDIYITVIGADGKEVTKNLGSTINTGMDESSPFLAPDYKTLYFASKGHDGLGGFDIYVSHRLDETWQNWSEPENLGPGINTANDEEFFNFTYDGQYAYFSRQVSAENSDIYRVSLASLYRHHKIENKDSDITSNHKVLEDMGLNHATVEYSLKGEYAKVDQ